MLIVLCLKTPQINKMTFLTNRVTTMTGTKMAAKIRRRPKRMRDRKNSKRTL